jgi:hypothetical protein
MIAFFGRPWPRRCAEHLLLVALSVEKAFFWPFRMFLVEPAHWFLSRQIRRSDHENKRYQGKL